MDKELIDRFPLSPRSKRPVPMAAAIPTTEKRPRAAVPLNKVVVPIVEVTAAAPVPVVTVFVKSNGNVAKAGAARTKATIRDLVYILEVNLVSN